MATDRFAGFAQRVWFTRDVSGRVTALHVGSGRAYGVVFERQYEAQCESEPLA